MVEGQPFRLVVVGGGIAGIEVATRIGRTLGRRGRIRLTLVDRGLAHIWKPNLHTIAAGTGRPEREKVGLLAHAKRNFYRFRPGALAGVDRERRVIQLGPFDDGTGTTAGVAEREIGYDALMLAIGSRANDFGIPGIAEHCTFIDSLPEADLFHARLRRALFVAAETGRALDVAIVGGGATGVELAAEIKHALNVMGRYGDAGRAVPPLRLTLAESGDRLLPAFPTRVSAEAARTLDGLGVRVLTGAAVSGADATGLQLKDGSRIDASLVAWAAGVRAPAALDGIEGLERSRSGQIVTTPTLQAKGDDAIFVLGDCGSLTDAAGKRVPPTAQAARQQAIHFARHVQPWLDGRGMAPFRYHDKGSIVSLADFNGWGTLGRVVFGGGVLKGLSARLTHDLLYRQHQLEVQGAARGAALWVSDGLDRVLSPAIRLD